MLLDDGSSAVSLPELPLLAVLPGTGGLTRITDKRKVRRDHADVFCTTEEGIKGKRAVEWRLVDEVVPPSKLEEAIRERVREFASKSDRPADAQGIALSPLQRKFSADGIEYQVAVGRIRPRPPRRDRHAARAGDAAAGRYRGRLWPRARIFGLCALPVSLTTPSFTSAPTSSISRPSSSNPRAIGEAGARIRCLPADQQRALAGARDHAVVEARAQAHRSHLALARRADRARILLCRHARRDRVRLRPLLHAGGPA